ncbi:cell wall-binding repeat-containing protein [Desulfitobacterium sp. AusDCA]|uniref:cell wall-binding repeat-containing protein n=1 Tax=Desulfitobacterium sp. AusDCA TaxID=3240383 RepID=UPI003DA74097
MLRKKSTSIILILTLILTLSFPALTFANTTPTITRLAGQDRYETASTISQQWSHSDYAILVSGENYPDALASAPLAQKFNAPILLTTLNSLPDSTKQALTYLQTKNVIIIGGTGVIAPSIEAVLQSMGISTTRVAGQDRYDTAIQISSKVQNSPSQVIVCTGDDFADALSIAPIAAIKQIPIILVSSDSLSDSVKDYINLNSANITKTYVIGYSDIINDSVASQFPNVERIVGADKYARNIAINEEFNNIFSANDICITTGEGFADALSGSALAAKKSEPIVLVNNDTPDNTKVYYQKRLANLSNIFVFGGTGIISEDVIQSLNTETGNSYPIPTPPAGSTGSETTHQTMKLSNFTKVGTSTATFKYQILDENGSDITSIIPASQLSGVASISSSVSLDPSKGIGTIIFNSPSDIDKPIIITLVDLTSGRTISLDSTSSTGSSSYTYPVNDPTPEIPPSSPNTDQKVAKITINSTRLAVSLQGIGYATYKVQDQYGNDITSSSLSNNIIFKNGVCKVSAKYGLLTLTPNPGINLYTLSTITINAYDEGTGVSTSATLTV